MVFRCFQTTAIGQLITLLYVNWLICQNQLILSWKFLSGRFSIKLRSIDSSISIDTGQLTTLQKIKITTTSWPHICPKFIRILKWGILLAKKASSQLKAIIVCFRKLAFKLLCDEIIVKVQDFFYFGVKWSNQYLIYWH